MRMVRAIEKKRDGLALLNEEIREMIAGYVAGEIPDYQMSAMLMAICLKGMTDEELAVLTDAMKTSGDVVDLSNIPGIKVDKHSTGGVGDKTTLIIAPMVAACGVKVAKMSGKGLGFTGGTIDKLESIPGFRTVLDREEFFAAVNKTGLSVIGQSGNLVPADKKLYALRDVTGTVESIPLIAASIMSKKLAAGSDCILLDVKTGSGAFMKTYEDSRMLAQKMVGIGNRSGKKTVALITDMEEPLGNHIGNALEIVEAIETLKGKGPQDLTRLCIQLAGNMLCLAGLGEIEDCLKKAEETIKDGSALDRFRAMVEAQGGDPKVVDSPQTLLHADFEYQVKAHKGGIITHIDAQMCGIASGMLGAGRETKESILDYSAGIALYKKAGDPVEAGETVAVLYASNEKLFKAAESQMQEAVIIGMESIVKKPLVLERITE